MRQNQKHFIGLDLGTSAIKGVLTDEAGNVLAEDSLNTKFLHPQDGWIEFSPEAHYSLVCSVIQSLAQKSDSPIAALAMAAASGNTLLTDAAGKPQTNIISWLDNRARQNPPKAIKGISQKDIHYITGWPCLDSFPLAHLAWLKENELEKLRHAEHVCMNTDWLLYRLTGRWLMDYSTATTFHLQDQRQQKYFSDYLELLDIPEAKLSRLVPSGTETGRLTAEARKDTGLSLDTKVVTGSFDHPAAALGVGVTSPGDLLLSCGTSWVGFIPCLERDRIIDAGMLCDPFLSNSGGPWAGMFSVPDIGRKIDWYIDNVIAPGQIDKFGIFDKSAAESLPGANGIKIDLHKEPKHMDAPCRDVSRALMEAAARMLNKELLHLKKFGFEFSKATMVGGPARSPVWPGIVAEITGLKINTGMYNAGAIGAAKLATLGVMAKDTPHGTGFQNKG